MIYLFFGDDTQSKLSAYEKFIQTVSLDAEVFKFTHNDLSQADIENFFSGQGLFQRKSLVVFLDVLDREETREFILGKLSAMAESRNIFVFLERKVAKPVLDVFRKSGAINRFSDIGFHDPSG